MFVPDTHSAFRISQVPGSPIRHIKHPSLSKENTHEHDIALIARHHDHDLIALVPICDNDGNCFATIRLIGKETDLRKHGFSKDLPGYCFDPNSVIDFQIPDADLLPHVIGRWAGSCFGNRGDQQTIDLLLMCFSSFFSASRNMYFRRDFDDDTLMFLTSTSSEIQKLLRPLKASIHNHAYMFSIVAERGAAEIVDDFPEDLRKDLRLNNNEWTPDKYYASINNCLGGKHFSYIGIPLKVDDAVLGVFQILAIRGEPRFEEAARFMRSALSEMGRTIDKRAMTRSSAIVRKLSANPASPKYFDDGVPARSKKLVEELVRQLIPHGKLMVDNLDARLGGKRETSKDLPLSISTYLQSSLVDIVLAGEVTLFVASERNRFQSIQGVIVIPIITALPFIIYISGPVSLLTGRTLRTALEHVQAAFNLALAATRASAHSNEEMANNRGHLKLWATIHDLKNKTASFATPLRDLIAVSANGNLSDIKEQILEFKESFSTALEEFELECNDIIRGTYFRSITEQPLMNILNKSLQIIGQFPKLVGRVQFMTNTPDALNHPIKTFAQELEMVLRELVRNILQHFEREMKSGTIYIDARESPKKTGLRICLYDDVSSQSDVAKVIGILNDATSKSSLRRQIKPTVDRLLQGELLAKKNMEYDSVEIILNLPKEVISH